MCGCQGRRWRQSADRENCILSGVCCRDRRCWRFGDQGVRVFRIDFLCHGFANLFGCHAFLFKFDDIVATAGEVDTAGEATQTDDGSEDNGDDTEDDDDLSTYSSHLFNMKNMMKQANGRSLLLIDEFGGGTEPQIGGAIAEAVLMRSMCQWWRPLMMESE